MYTDNSSSNFSLHLNLFQIRYARSIEPFIQYILPKIFEIFWYVFFLDWRWGHLSKYIKPNISGIFYICDICLRFLLFRFHSAFICDQYNLLTEPICTLYTLLKYWMLIYLTYYLRSIHLTDASNTFNLIQPRAAQSLHSFRLTALNHNGSLQCRNVCLLSPRPTLVTTTIRWSAEYQGVLKTQCLSTFTKTNFSDHLNSMTSRVPRSIKITMDHSSIVMFVYFHQDQL